MNKGQIGDGGSGRLMGQVNYDAGIMRFRQFVSRSHQEAVKPPRAPGRGVQRHRQRKVAVSVAAVVLLLSIAVAGVAQGNCLRLCPGLGGAGAASYSVESPGPALIAESAFAAGERAIEAAAWGRGGGGCYVVQCGGFSQFVP